MSKPHNDKSLTVCTRWRLTPGNVHDKGQDKMAARLRARAPTHVLKMAAREFATCRKKMRQQPTGLNQKQGTSLRDHFDARNKLRRRRTNSWRTKDDTLLRSSRKDQTP
ncbi:unnamed protein product [Lasius platythorax]|uniref:Uncharacterized protein n=1 Tax=Lasius platythorax TaxID=488582 RepID=A0AAV2MY96_9HYME